MKKIKKSYSGGNLRTFKTYLNKQKEKERNFKVISSGLSRCVIFESGIKFNFFPNDKGSRIEGAYFVNMVRSRIDKYIEKNGLLPICNDAIQVQLFNTDAIALRGLNPISCLDLNSCYWRTANLLGYIDDELYEKGVKSGFKKGLLISIGSLNKLKHIEVYKDGKLNGKPTIDEEYRNKYSPFYWNIISKVRDLMMRVYEELGEDFYMWLTDCAFVHPDKTKAVEKIFKEEGYPYKIYKAEFTYFDGLQVNWYDFKSKNPKGMPISNRHIENDYMTWRAIQDFNTKINSND